LAFFNSVPGIFNSSLLPFQSWKFERLL